MKQYQVTTEVVTEEQEVAEKVARDIEDFLAHHPLASRLSRAQVHTDPFMQGGAADRGKSFDREAARTSGVTVDVTQPGGVS